MNPFKIHWDDECGVAALGRLLERRGMALVEAAPGDPHGRTMSWIVGELGTAQEHDSLGQDVWNIRYDASAEENGATRSLTMKSFPFHTDGSFEEPPPRYLAQYVVKEDRFGGGETLLVKAASVLRRLTAPTCEVLRSTRFRFRVPAEFDKGLPFRDVPILFGEGLMRYRREIIDDEAAGSARAALDELDAAIESVEPVRLRLRSGMILLLDNARFLHARTEVRDPERHLLRMRFSCNAPVMQDSKC